MENTLKLVAVRFEYEDKLPKTTDLIYEYMFRVSQVIDGVRMFPYIELEGDRFYLTAEC